MRLYSSLPKYFRDINWFIKSCISEFRSKIEYSKVQPIVLDELWKIYQMWINARKISFPRLKQCISHYHDLRREPAWTQVHCLMFFSTLHIYSSTCKHTHSIYNLVIVCLHTCYPKNSIKSIKSEVHFCLEKYLFNIFG